MATEGLELDQQTHNVRIQGPAGRFSPPTLLLSELFSTRKLNGYSRSYIRHSIKHGSVSVVCKSDSPGTTAPRARAGAGMAQWYSPWRIVEPFGLT